MQGPQFSVLPSLLPYAHLPPPLSAPSTQVRGGLLCNLLKNGNPTYAESGKVNPFQGPQPYGPDPSVYGYGVEPSKLPASSYKYCVAGDIPDDEKDLYWSGPTSFAGEITALPPPLPLAPVRPPSGSSALRPPRRPAASRPPAH